MKHLNLIDKAFLLKKTSLFGSLDLDLLLTISDKMELVTFKQGEKIFQVDQDAYRMYLIVEGAVSIESKDKKNFGDLHSGEFFGDEAIFNEQPRAYEALSHTDVVLLSLSRNHLMSIIAECPSVAVALLEAYTQTIDFRKRH